MTRDTEGNVNRGRANIEGRWAAHRAARLAAGLPATVSEETGRKARFLDAGIESHWLAEAQRLGLAEGLGRTALRRLAMRLANAAGAEEVARIESAGPSAPLLGDDEILVAHFSAEADLWRARAIRDRALAAQHDRQAEAAEAALADLLWKLGQIQ